MKISKHLTGFAVILLAAMALLVSLGTGKALALKLYISEAGGAGNSVKVVDLDLVNQTGVVDYFVKPPDNGGLSGPRGILFNGGNLLVANQNTGLQIPIPGEILSFDGTFGAFLGAFVAASDKKNAPFAPRGIILGNQTDAAFLYVASIVSSQGRSLGSVNTYDANGKLLAELEAKGFPNKEFHPRGVVFGPDGLLYVSLRTIQGKYKGADPGGWVLRFNPDGSFKDVFIADPGGMGQLNRPEGLVFGPDGNLYITSFPFPSYPDDTSSIRIYNPDGTFLKKIDLGQFDQDPNIPAFAIALLFGPDGNLFVPIYNTPNLSASKGQLRSYDINDLNNIVETVYTLSSPNPDLQPDPLLAPWYLTFETTDPHTLAFE
jgi:hypothetical protein